MIKPLFTLFLSLYLFAGFTQSNTRQIQTELTQSDLIVSSPLNKQVIWANAFSVFNLDFESLDIELNGSDIPHRNDPNSGNLVLINLPNPNGVFEVYKVYRNTTMHPDLQAQFPEIRTFDIVGFNNRNLLGKIDITPHGFHAMIFDRFNGTYFIDPIQQENNSMYMVYYKSDFVTDKSMSCNHSNEAAQSFGDILIEEELDLPLSYATCQLRTYRLALAATGEYTIYHGGTVALALAAQVTTMNRVNGIYERELAVTMEIIANNNLIIYTNPATDPYSGSDVNHLGQNITNCSNVIGNANFDIGHVFLQGGNSGVAYLSSVCNNSLKAGGVTGQGAPIGDPFDVDYVSHEMGHQFGANHTQNNNCNRNNPTAMEPGSASTIMGYAGICAPNVQNNSDDHFHGVSLLEMGNFITGSGGTCAVITNIPNSAPTITSTNGGFTLPISTPFALTSVATDPNAGDILWYRWEQMNNNVTTQPPVSTATGGPNFRSFSSTTNPTRYFPRLEAIVNNGPFTWEVLPSVARTMNFRCTVHDDHVVGGCSDYVNTTVTFDASAGPFVLTYPSATGITWQATTTQTVTWNVANTTNANVNCQNVNIYLSTDGGFNYPTLLASNVPNNGSANVTVPNLPNTTSRVMVMATNGTFFDVSDNNFTITVAPNGYQLNATNPSLAVCAGTNANFNFDILQLGSYTDPVTLSFSGLPIGATASWTNNPVIPAGTSTLSINTNAVAQGTYVITVNSASTFGPQSVNVTLQVAAGTPQAVTLVNPTNGASGLNPPLNLSWNPSATPNVTYQIDIATDNGFSNIVESQSGLNATNYTSLNLNAATTYYWRVRVQNPCGFSAYSSVFSFTTSSCIVVNSNNVPVVIPANAVATVTSTINITQSGTINNVDILNLIGTHTWMEDLYFTLISPQGTSVNLFGGICGNQDNFNLNLSDNAAPGAIPCPPTSGLTYQPTGSLSDFIGEEMQGVWTLSIFDDFAQDGGSLNSWSLDICFDPPNGYQLVSNSPSLTVCAGTNAQFNFDVFQLGSYTDPVTFSFSNLPAGASANWSINPVFPQPSPVGSTLNVNTAGVAQGTYVINVTTTSTSGTQNANVTLNVVSNTSPPVTLIAPISNATGVSIPTNFSWNPSVLTNVTYTIQIATDLAFSNIIVDESGINITSYTTGILNDGTTYFWRVRVENVCGSSVYSAVEQFTTASCQTFASVNVPVNIPASGTPTVTSTITVAQAGTINNVDVLNLIGTHTWVSDLFFTITSPQGTVVNLFGGVCGNQDNFNLNFSDNAAPGAIPCPPTSGLTYQPTGSLADFIGQEMQGVWTLTINDVFDLDGGSLNSWSLNICSDPPGCAVPSIEPASIDIVGTPYCIGGELTLTQVGGSLAPGADFEWFSASCGGTALGTGTTIQVAPTVNTSYFVRASAGVDCPETVCAQIDVNVVVPDNSLSIDNDEATCLVNSGNWVHFYNIDGRLIASVNSNGQNLGDVTATSYVNGAPFVVASCSDPSDPEFFNAALARSFVITPQFQPTNPVTVRLYIMDAEYVDYQNAALATTENPFDNINTLGELNLTKHSGTSQDGDPTNNCGGGTTLFIPQSASGATGTIFPSIASSSYLEYVIDGFSEFFPMNSNNSALPVELTSFEAICRESDVLIQWSTSSELNASHFRIESSRDGYSWLYLAELDASGTTSQAQTYQYFDFKFANTTVYYRLVQVDYDGLETSYAPIHINCQSDENQMSVYPNPTRNEFNLSIASAENFGQQTIVVTDLSGKIVHTHAIDLTVGSYLIPFENLNWSQGTYLVFIDGLAHQFKPLRIVIQ